MKNYFVILVAFVIFASCESKPIRIMTEEKVIATPKKMIIDIIMPAYIEAEQSDINLIKSDPEAYADRFNRNSGLYNRAITFPYENGLVVGDTVQLKYSEQYLPPQQKYWELASIRPPFKEEVLSGLTTDDYWYKELVIGIVQKIE